MSTQLIDQNASLTATKRPIDLGNVLFLTVTPIVAFAGTALYVHYNGVRAADLAIFAVMYILSGLSITAGYHRYFSHKTYECSKPLQLFYLIFGAAAFENTVLHWSSDHRYHHQFVDQEEDPYNILKGGFYAHMGWILLKNPRPRSVRFQNIPDLLKNPLAVWQDKHYLSIAITAGFVLPTLVGLAFGHPLAGLLWGGFLRVVLVEHMTFLINSAAQLYGSRPYSLDNTARDNAWLGIVTFGEGYHNFHHRFPADYRNGLRAHQFDATKWWLLAMRPLGLVSNLKRTPESLIVKARLEVELRALSEKFAPREATAPHASAWTAMRERLETLKRSIELSFAQYHQARRDYKAAHRDVSTASRRKLLAALENRRQEFRESLKKWSGTVSLLNRLPQPSAQLVTLTALVDLLKQSSL